MTDTPDSPLRHYIKAEMDYLGTINGTGEIDPDGSYIAVIMTDKGNAGEEPQRHKFLVPAHQFPSADTRPAPAAVRALTWKPYASDGSSLKAETDLAHYVIWEIGGDGILSTEPDKPGRHVGGDLEAAKAAAQADYEARVLAALSPAPVEGLIEALRDYVEAFDDLNDPANEYGANEYYGMLLEAHAKARAALDAYGERT